MNHAEACGYNVPLSVPPLVRLPECDVVVGVCLEEPVEVEVAAEDDGGVEEVEELVQQHEAVQGLAVGRGGLRAGLGQHQRNVLHLLSGEWKVVHHVDEQKNLLEIFL